MSELQRRHLAVDFGILYTWRPLLLSDDIEGNSSKGFESWLRGNSNPRLSRVIWIFNLYSKWRGFLLSGICISRNLRFTYIYYVYVKYIFSILFKKKEIEGD